MTTLTQTRTQPHQTRDAISRAGLYVVCIALAIVFLFPILWTITSSLKPPREAVAVPPLLIPSQLSIENYLKLDRYGEGLGQYFSNSLITAIMTVVGSIILSTLGGYGFSRFQFPGKGILFIMILATLMIPFQSILIPLFLILTSVKLHNTLFGLALVYITFQLPFGIFIMRNTFDTVPRELEEAALLDGCTALSLLYRVMLGIVRPGIITVGIYAFINSWNEFIAALIFMTKEKNFTMPILLTSVRSGYYGAIDWGALQAGLVISMLPCIILFLLLQRYYVRGLMGGAMKG